MNAKYNACERHGYEYKLIVLMTCSDWLHNLFRQDEEVTANM